MAEEAGRSGDAPGATPPDARLRDRFFAELDSAYEALWADPHARLEELNERKLWEATLADGLDD